MITATGWCFCKTFHSDTSTCPGPLAVDINGKTQSCRNCGTKYQLGVKACQTAICNQCNGKRL